MNKITLNSNYNTYKEVIDQIDNLDKIYRKKYKRALTVDLTLASSGDRKKPKLELVAHYSEENKNEVEILLNLLQNNK